MVDDAINVEGKKRKIHVAFIHGKEQEIKVLPYFLMLLGKRKKRRTKSLKEVSCIEKEISVTSPYNFLNID
ncbi:CLUMA_CG005847, isoform A [Clunio marinus]|uniref:CLUMA_CG005847, isoform A n=1 Tax=Clunio marinus TaxID=568069 RepID=A0A1J1HW11_9DIPT|nr:CLUMA_CG005847, isoform A [Clunio marinus]